MSRTRKAGVLLLAVTAVYFVVRAGSLEPPGPPAPTMKTLSEVEPRTPIHATDLPLVIATPGSYYLAENITTGGDGISITADNVSIDLRGFTLAGGTGDGISAASGTKNLTVGNGTVSGWPGSGVSFGFSFNARISQVRVEANNDIGIQAGENAVVDECIASNNAGGGIRASLGSMVKDCVARSNGGSGILAWESTLTGCTVKENTLHGIEAVSASVNRCAAIGNGDSGIGAAEGSTVVACSAVSNGMDGFVVSNSTIRDSTATANIGNGILVTSNSYVIDNTCERNGYLAADGAGIRVNINGSRIDGNTVAGNDRGIQVVAFGNTILRNSARGNTTNYSIAPANDVGPIGSAMASTSPFANIVF